MASANEHAIFASEQTLADPLPVQAAFSPVHPEFSTHEHTTFAAKQSSEDS